MMTKIALLNSTAFLPGIKSIKKKRQAFVLIFYVEETSGIGCGAERRDQSVGCSGRDCSGEVNKWESTRKKRIYRWMRQKHFKRGFIKIRKLLPCVASSLLFTYFPAIASYLYILVRNTGVVLLVLSPCRSVRPGVESLSIQSEHWENKNAGAQNMQNQQ